MRSLLLVALALIGCGSGIAVGRIVETRYDIYMVPLDGGPEEQVTDDPYDDMDPSWTPF